MQSVFCRYEKKYLLTSEQLCGINAALSRYMTPDNYAKYLVQNIYFDTENWDVVRASIENPVYKEKMRLRCYSDSEIFLELKKKYNGLVCKRRIPVSKAKSVHNIVMEDSSQIGREFEFYLRSNPVFERIYISYNRTAFSGDDELRITFDENLKFRSSKLNFSHPNDGQPITNDIIMEIKTPAAIPMWLAKVLSENKIFPISFSKYGTCYKNHILNKPHLIYEGTRKIARAS
ncbi:MAG: polyphosphate polymerase domain-containing protein [Clostridiales bacterium]|jgi:hypothetical protein|nr:polyphosphate polymerase domain-containing protein [Clostridiales bacterium]